MQISDIQTRVQAVQSELSKGNSYGEKVMLVAATKMQTVEHINAAICAGVDAVAENKPQEFRDKNEFLLHCPRHFIGHLQTNKIKYLIGKIDFLRISVHLQLPVAFRSLSRPSSAPSAKASTICSL